MYFLNRFLTCFSTCFRYLYLSLSLLEFLIFYFPQLRSPSLFSTVQFFLSPSFEGLLVMLLYILEFHVASSLNIRMMAHKGS
jgi:hypothetical protein